MTYPLDTNTCSEYLRGRREVVRQLRFHAGQCSISAISAGELYAWVFRAKSSPRWFPIVDAFIERTVVHDVTLDIGRMYGRLRAELLDRGRPLATSDLLIAATALIHDLKLVTHNTRDFIDIPGIELLDWQSH